jgi:hypothetical protein
MHEAANDAEHNIGVLSPNFLVLFHATRVAAAFVNDPTDYLKMTVIIDYRK